MLVSLGCSVPAGRCPNLMDNWIFFVMVVSEEAQIYSPLDMTHTQLSMALVMSAGEEAPLNQVPVHK